jgi:putative oxidoreductase
LNLSIDASWLDTLGRWLIVACFLIAGVCNLTRARIKDHIDRMIAFHTPLPTFAFWCGIVLQFVGCVLVATGWHVQAGAWCLIIFTVLATVIFHRFWNMIDPMRRNVSRLMLLNNTGIVGGLLLLVQNAR